MQGKLTTPITSFLPVVKYHNYGLAEPPPKAIECSDITNRVPLCQGAAREIKHKHIVLMITKISVNENLCKQSNYF